MVQIWLQYFFLLQMKAASKAPSYLYPEWTQQCRFQGDGLLRGFRIKVYMYIQ